MDADVLIIGGGLNGPALALALARAGIAAAVLDTRPHPSKEGEDGRAYALSAASVRLLEALGTWGPLAGTAQPIREIKVADGRPETGPAPFFVHFPEGELEEGPMGWMVEDRHLRPTLHEALDAAAGVTLHTGEAAVVHGTDGARAWVETSAGRRLRGRLIVAADGRDSPTAQRAGITRSVTDYGQTALVVTIAHERPHEGIAHQLFLPGGPLAILPLAGDRSSIVWSERTALARAIHALDDAGFLAELAPRFGSFLGEIALAGPRFAYPLVLSLAERMIGERLALVGDAAHGIHPVAGQGLNLGLRDVAALAEVVVDARRRGEDIGAPAVLERYARWRSFDVASLAAATDGVVRLFSNDRPALRALRDLGLGMVDRLPALKRAFIREAAGLTGELPRLMRGRPL